MVTILKIKVPQLPENSEFASLLSRWHTKYARRSLGARLRACRKRNGHQQASQQISRQHDHTTKTDHFRKHQELVGRWQGTLDLLRLYAAPLLIHLLEILHHLRHRRSGSRARGDFYCRPRFQNRHLSYTRGGIYDGSVGRGCRCIEGGELLPTR